MRAIERHSADVSGASASRCLLLLTSALLVAALPLRVVFADTVTVIGADGLSGADGADGDPGGDGAPGQPGEDASATASTSDPDNVASASAGRGGHGGYGGDGVPDGAAAGDGGHGGAGGQAISLAETLVDPSGTRSRATANGGDGGYGGLEGAASAGGLPGVRGNGAAGGNASSTARISVNHAGRGLADAHANAGDAGALGPMPGPAGNASTVAHALNPGGRAESLASAKGGRGAQGDAGGTEGGRADLAASAEGAYASIDSEAAGGDGGGAPLGRVGGRGGVAQSSSTGVAVGGSVDVTDAATGGEGGGSGFSRNRGGGGVGGDAHSHAEGIGSLGATVDVEAVAEGGQGGTARGEGLVGGRGGGGSATAFGSSDTGDVHVRAEFRGGAGGSAPLLLGANEYAAGGDGGDATLVDAVSGSTGGSLWLEQHVAGGDGGDSFLQGGHGGNGVSTLDSANLVGNGGASGLAIAYGGEGGDLNRPRFVSARAGDGGDATARIDALGTGRTVAVGGAGGSSEEMGRGGRGGDALAESLAQQAASHARPQASARGGDGGVGEDGSDGGDGGEATAISVATTFTVARDAIIQSNSATGGAGGNTTGGTLRGSGGRGGDAWTHAAGIAGGDSAVRVNDRATGGDGGSNGGVSGPSGSGGDGGHASSSVEGSNQGASSITFDSTATGGRGGSGIGAGHRGGDGGVAAVRSTATSLTGDVEMELWAFGGDGGSGHEGADGGHGADVVLKDTVAVQTAGRMYVVQHAYGGDAGHSWDATSGRAGDAESHLEAIHAGSDLFLWAGSVGGDGAGYPGEGTRTAGGDALSVVDAENTQGTGRGNARAEGGSGGGWSIAGGERGGRAEADVSISGTDLVTSAGSVAIGGRGGIGGDALARATAFGTQDTYASARATGGEGRTGGVSGMAHAIADATGNGGMADSVADASAVLLSSIEASALAPVVGNVQAEARAAVHGVLSDRAETAGLESLAWATGRPSRGQVADVLATNPNAAAELGTFISLAHGLQGAGYAPDASGETLTFTSTVDLSIDLSVYSVLPEWELMVALLDPEASGTIDRVEFQVSKEGEAPFFLVADSAAMFETEFDDRLWLRLGDLADGLEGDLDVTLSFLLESNDPGAAASISYLVAFVPEPGTGVLVGIGLAGFSAARRRRRLAWARGRSFEARFPLEDRLLQTRSSSGARG